MPPFSNALTPYENLGDDGVEFNIDYFSIYYLEKYIKKKIVY